MLALSLTFLAATFVLAPDLLARWILGFVVTRRSLTQNRGEEITRAAVWAAGPLVLVIFWIRSRHILGQWGSWVDIQNVASGLYSNSFFDLHREVFFTSLVRVAGMCSSMLWRLYLVVFLMAMILNIAILRYRWLRSVVSSPWAKAVVATIVLPRVSEWHVLLSDMLLPTDDVSLEVDVLTKSAILYKGRVQDRMLATDGSLQTLTLADPSRFLRDDFRKAKETDPKTKVETYWRPIPGKLFVILASDIVSINVRYPPNVKVTPALTKPELTRFEIDALRELLSKLTAPDTSRQG